MKKILVLIIGFFVLFGSSFSFANADTSYTFYWGQGCPHCANVESYFKAVDAESKITIDKEEVFTHPDNAKKMSDNIERLGLDSSKIGVPFMIVNKDGVETTFSGDTPIIDYFIPILGEAPENNNRTIILIILGLLAILIPVFIIKKSK